MKNKKKILALACVFAAIATVFAVIYFFALPKTQDGRKTFTLEVVLTDGTTYTETVKTEAEYLGNALLEAKLIEGSESQYGLFITTVKGVKADSEKQEWWCLTVDHKEWSYGADQTPVTDGGHYELTLKTGW